MKAGLFLLAVASAQMMPAQKVCIKNDATSDVVYDVQDNTQSAALIDGIVMAGVSTCVDLGAFSGAADGD